LAGRVIQTLRWSCDFGICSPPTEASCEPSKGYRSKFERFRQIGGALIFAVYEDAREGEAEALTAITAALPELDKGTLVSLGCRRIDKRAFFGDCYDTQTDAILRVGEFTTRDGEKLVNPRRKDLEGNVIWLGSSPLPEAGTGGQFAYVFSCRPYARRSRGARGCDDRWTSSS
jgi:hypothetical protein